MKLCGASIIGGARAKGAGSLTPAQDPSNGEPLEPGYAWATKEDVACACKLAADAFEELANTTANRRAGLLRAIADGLEANATEIAARATVETALPGARIQGEMGRTCGQLRLFAKLIEEGWWLDARIDHGDPTRTPVPKPDVRSMVRPLGPVVVFSSSNFPLAFSVAGGDTASALAAGCPVIVKPHQGHLGTSELVGWVVCEAVRKSELPVGCFSLVFGPGRDVGMALVTNPLVRAVGFTGSRAGGRALMDAAAARPQPIPVYAEMGSINPVFLLPKALAARGGELAKGLHGSVTLGNGQFCTNPGLVFCPSGPEGDSFLAQLAEYMKGTVPGVMLTTSICEEYHSGAARFSKHAGVNTLVRVAFEKQVGASQCGAALFSTDAETFLASPDLMDEVFGPSTLVVRTSSIEQMIACALQLEGQLTATIHAQEAEVGEYPGLARILEMKAGRLVMNGFPTGVEVCHAMHHGGPYPATSEGRSTSVGTRAIDRFARPVCYQGFPDAALPLELREANPLGLARLVDGKWGIH